MKAGWKSVPLLEACEAYQPKTIGRKDMSDDGPYPVFGANGIIGRYRSYNHEESEILLGCRGSCGSVNVSLPKSWVTGNAMVVRPRDERLTKDFLRYSLDGSAAIAKVITGVAQPQITQQSLAAVTITLPPLEEQRRIVAVLDEAFAAIATATANAEKNLANARELFESCLDLSFNQKKSGWREDEVANLCIVGDGNHSSKYPKNSEMIAEGVPFLRSSNIQDGEISIDDVLYISAKKHAELRKGHLKSGDILFTNRGEIGKVAIVPKFLNGSNLNSQIAWLRCNANLMPEYLYFFLQSGVMRKHFLQNQSGSALQQFPIRMIKAMRVPFPGLGEQRRLVALLSEISVEAQSIGETARLKIQALYALKSALLNSAFTGELTATAPATIAA